MLYLNLLYFENLWRFWEPEVLEESKNIIGLQNNKRRQDVVGTLTKSFKGLEQNVKIYKK